MQKPKTDLAAEMIVLKERMFSMLHIWVMLEDRLSMLLQNTIMPSNVNQKKFGFAIYFAPDSAFMRFQIVDAVMDEFFDEEPHRKEALAAWSELLRRLNKVKGARNRIAHGTVSAPTIYGKQYARISGPMFEIKRHEGRVQADGMSVNEVEEAIRKCGRCLAGIQSMGQIVMATRLKNHDTDTLRQICRELEAHLKSESDQVFAPNPPILPLPPQSS